MKVQVLVTAVALACGTAFAAQNSSGSVDSVTSANQPAATQPASGGLVDKTRRAFHRMGDATRHTMHRIANAGHRSKDASADTRNMGAAGTGNAADDARRSRMDDAYARWAARHKK